ncbi:unnamed protein product [Allacma fusca]|uniref:C2H2-type domain-containing protein n=1 Tax=Allacma fusca TaxID=39272 RepID=A0A8J2PD98_9HEXA|nr:unnamed protein product [Allacma fusca]
MSVESLLSTLGMPPEREVDLLEPGLGLQEESALSGFSKNSGKVRVNEHSTDLDIRQKFKYCAMCAKAIIGTVAVPDNLDLLQILCSILNFPSIMPSLTEKKLSVSNAQFCEDCVNTIVASRNFLRQIKLLEENLDQLKDQMKKSIRCSFKVTTASKDSRDEESTAVYFLWKLFAQSLGDYSLEPDEVGDSILEQEDLPAKIITRSLRRKYMTATTSARANILVEEEESQNGCDTLKDASSFGEKDSPSISAQESHMDSEDSEEFAAKIHQRKSQLERGTNAKPNGVTGITRSQVSKKKGSKKPYSCNECGKGYLSQRMYEAHLKIHTGELEYACQHCEKKFTLKKYLQLHNRKAHNIANTIRTDGSNCPHCGLNFHQFPNSEGSTQEETVDNTIENHSSEQVSLTWSEEKTRRGHIQTCPENPRVKYKNKPTALKIPCKLCEKQFVCVSSLESHIASIHEKKFKFYCEICAAGFVILSDLRRHIEGVHTDEKKYQCEICDLTFKRSHQVFYHRRMHTGERPFICEVCGKGFHLAEKLKQHLAVHVTENQHPCPLCGKMFKSLHYVRNHINTTHKGSRKGRQKKSQFNSKNSSTITS